MVRSQAFVRDLDSRTLCLSFDGAEVNGAQLRSAVSARSGLPLSEMRVTTGMREVTDTCVLRAGREGLLPSCTVLLRLCGGKVSQPRPLIGEGMTLETEKLTPPVLLFREQGGFGSLLRGAGKAGVQTSNFDSCRDLDGRRLRHVNAEKKIHEWKVRDHLPLAPSTRRAIK